MDSTNLLEINKAHATQALSEARHKELLAYQAKTADNVLLSTEALIKFLEGKVSKTEVVNQLESISTPDVEYVVKALNVLDDTLKTHENTDLTEITQVMQGILDEAKLLPKELPVIPEPKDPIDNTKQFQELTKAIQAVEKVVKAQELIAEAPDLKPIEKGLKSVTAAVIAKDLDLKPLQDGFKDVVKAVTSIVIPEYKTDNKEVEKLLEKANKTLQKLLEKPIGGGGGGGGSSWVGTNSAGTPLPLSLNTSGGLITATQALTERYATAGGYDYIGEAAVGSSEAAAVWTISRYDSVSGKVAVNATWTNYLTETYA